MANSRKHNNNSSVRQLSEIANTFPPTEVCSETSSDVFISKEVLNPHILFVEPFYTGSHKELIDLLHDWFPKSRLITLSGKKWPWRARCSALILSSHIPQITTEKTIFCSSVLSLAELLGLRPDLQKLKKIVYFHENQFVYPIRQIKDRDVQYAYNQITTCLAADELVFNSEFNLRSLLDNLNKVVKLLPDYRPKDMQLKIQPKCKVLYFPVWYPLLPDDQRENLEYLTIVWPHRWEFDKAPEVFINILTKLKQKNLNFRVHILGGNFADVPDVLNDVKESLKENILTFGFVESKDEYYDILINSDVVVSTAIHEFFGVAMLEAMCYGCFPIVPNKLVYPEIYPPQCLYNDEAAAVKMLTDYCKNPSKARIDRHALDCGFDFGRFAYGTLRPRYGQLLK